MEHARTLSLDAQATSRTDALAHLFLLLAHAFSYPTHERARWLTSQSFLLQAIDLSELVALESDSLFDAALRFNDAAMQDAESRAHSLRVEHTRLFYSMPRIIPLVGTRWVQSGGSLAARQSERAVVDALFRDLGLRVQQGKHEPADHIVCELDYAAYVTAAEYQAWKGQDAASAHDWISLRNSFVNMHLADTAFGIAQAISKASTNAHLLFHAALLEAVVESCLPA
ncbi:MAG: molecular chaperone TorD family protein [Eggerthellaceae bacterium]|nr:molecular chaperone TorD family protein [Eggerthellaceae bacterium]